MVPGSRPTGGIPELTRRGHVAQTTADLLLAPSRTRPQCRFGLIAASFGGSPMCSPCLCNRRVLHVSATPAAAPDLAKQGSPGVAGVAPRVRVGAGISRRRPRGCDCPQPAARGGRFGTCVMIASLVERRRGPRRPRDRDHGQALVRRRHRPTRPTSPLDLSGLRAPRSRKRSCARCAISAQARRQLAVGMPRAAIDRSGCRPSSSCGGGCVVPIGRGGYSRRSSVRHGASKSAVGVQGDDWGGNILDRHRCDPEVGRDRSRQLDRHPDCWDNYLRCRISRPGSCRFVHVLVVPSRPHRGLEGDFRRLAGVSRWRGHAEVLGSQSPSTSRSQPAKP